MQRTFDILLSGVAILVLSPLLLPLLVLLRLTGEGEVFYRQARVGRGGTDFFVLKFATMLKDSPSLGAGTVTVQNDPRVLPVGRILRKTKVNELPQLFNVFRGDMSLIGPRPLTRNTFEAFPAELQPIISSVRPGLSGLGSVIFRDEEEILRDRHNPREFHREVITPYKGALEHWYVQHKGLATYFALIGLTLWVVFFSESRLVWRVFPSLPHPPEALSMVRPG